MSERHPKSEVIWHVIGIAIVLCAVTATVYIWRLPQAHNPRAVLAVYIVSATLLLGGAFVIFRRVVRQSYEQYLCLTPLPFLLQLLIWGLFFAFPCIYNPINWAWSQSSSSRAIPILESIGWACVGVGLAVVLVAMAWLGLPRSFGQKGGRIEMSGPYRLTRNPQLMGGALLIIGYVLLWPTWYALGWLVLYPVIMHMMVLTEEEHLRCYHGEEFKQYCQRVPRYLGFPKRP